MKVLVMDNDPTDRFILKKLLEGKYELVFFENPQEALHYAAVNPIDVALVNIHLGNLWNDLEYMLNLKKSAIHPFTSIALISYLPEKTLKLMRDSGYDLILSFPPDVTKLEEVLGGQGKGKG